MSETDNVVKMSKTQVEEVEAPRAVALDELLCLRAQLALERAAALAEKAKAEEDKANKAMQSLVTKHIEDADSEVLINVNLEERSAHVASKEWLAQQQAKGNASD